MLSYNISWDLWETTCDYKYNVSWINAYAWKGLSIPSKQEQGKKYELDLAMVTVYFLNSRIFGFVTCFHLI